MYRHTLFLGFILLVFSLARSTAQDRVNAVRFENPPIIVNLTMENPLQKKPKSTWAMTRKTSTSHSDVLGIRT
jgi:hypothetical protein